VTAIDTLVAEHRLIEQMLTLLERLAGRLDRGGDLASRLLNEVIDLLEQYSDKLHHSKEERRLFEIVIERGLEAEGAAVSALIHHHETGRSQLQDLRNELHRLKQGDRTAAAACAMTAHQYADLLREHIRVEDEDVFPLVAQALSVEEDRVLATYFTKIDDERHATDLQTRFGQLLVRCAELGEPRAPGDT
jgi:hemerythrin-like domain-containing protein